MPVRYGSGIWGGWGGATDIDCNLCGSVSDLIPEGDLFLCISCARGQASEGGWYLNVEVRPIPKAQRFPNAEDIELTGDLL